MSSFRGWNPLGLKCVAMPATMGVAISCRQGDEHSKLGGAEDVGVNPLEPGEEQIVSAMQQAPDYVSMHFSDVPREVERLLGAQVFQRGEFKLLPACYKTSARSGITTLENVIDTTAVVRTSMGFCSSGGCTPSSTVDARHCVDAYVYYCTAGVPLVFVLPLINVTRRNNTDETETVSFSLI